MKKTLTIIFSIFSVIGIILLLIACVLAFNNFKFINNAKHTTGTVINYKVSYSRDSSSNHDKVTYYPIVAFKSSKNVDVVFNSSVGSNNYMYPIGQQIEVLYNPDNANEAKINSFISLWFVEIVLAGLGGVFTLTGLIYFVINRIKYKRKVKLLQTGVRLNATFDSVQLNTSVRVNRRSPFVIICNWVDPLDKSEIYQFISERIWFNPQQFMTEQQSITVFVDKDNYRKYHVDISFLPKMKN